MAVEGTWKGGVNFHRELIPYLDSIGPENQKQLAGPKIKCLAGWQVYGSLGINEGWGGEPPIRRAIMTDQREGNHSTRNLARG
jgi:hypothetical protein